MTALIIARAPVAQRTFAYYISPTGDDVTGTGTLLNPFSITWLGYTMNRVNTLLQGLGWTAYAGKTVGLIGDQGPYTQGSINGAPVTLQSIATFTGTDAVNQKFQGGSGLLINGGTPSSPTVIASCNTLGQYAPRLAVIDWTSGTNVPTNMQFTGIANWVGSGGFNSPALGNITLDGLVLNGAGVGFTYGGVAASPNSNISIINCEIKNCVGYSNNNPSPLAFNTCNNLLIQNNKIHDNYDWNFAFQAQVQADVNVTAPNTLTITQLYAGWPLSTFGFGHGNPGPQIWYVYKTSTAGSTPIASFTVTSPTNGTTSVPQSFALDQLGITAVASQKMWIGASSQFPSWMYAWVTFNSTNIQVLNNTVYRQGLVATKDHYQGPITVAYNYVEFGDFGGAGTVPAGNPLGTGTSPVGSYGIGCSNVVGGLSSLNAPFSASTGASHCNFSYLGNGPINLTQNFHHNIFVCSANAAQMSGQDSCANENQVTWDHNTFYFPSGSSASPVFMKMANSTAAGLVGSVQYTNNVLWNDAGSMGAGAWWGVTGTQNGTALAGLGGLSSNYNAWPSTMTWGTAFSSTTYTGLAAWQAGSTAATGSPQDVNSINLSATPFAITPLSKTPASFALAGAALTASSSGGTLGALDGTGTIGCNF